MWRCCLNRGICEFVGVVEQDDVGVVDYRGR